MSEETSPNFQAVNFIVQMERAFRGSLRGKGVDVPMPPLELMLEVSELFRNYVNEQVEKLDEQKKANSDRS